MPSYAAFLGHQPRISVAELAATIGDFRLKRMLPNHICLFETERDLTQEDLNKWGGIYLVARQITEGSVTLDDIPKMLAAELTSVRGKVTFGFRAEGIARGKVRDLYRTCKDALKKQGRSSRYVGNERIPAAAALLRDTGMISGKHGAELVLLGKEGDEEEFLWIGKTVAAQDPNSYTKRDMEKPVRDTRAGLLPPKLAQMLLNFGVWVSGKDFGHRTSDKGNKKNPKSEVSSPKSFAVLDPFCGTGVIPMECILRGLPVIASDAAIKAVTGCEKNLEWLRKIYDIKKSEVPGAVSKHNALQPFSFSDLRDPILKTGPAMIVTESHLGPALSDRPNAKEAAKLRTENEALQIAFLKNVAATLPGVPVVVTWPVWYLKTGPLFLEKVWKALPDLGFNPMLPPHCDPEIPGHFSLLYRRPEQIVGREIVILKPRK
ncbi:hypothetical protein HZA45_01650 [Candidatus Peregrinibacteria bacterium]|nr:hypothetical protein [Candidatus Peregrinibacteria bacterium]